jgi:hypothetical protein
MIQQRIKLMAYYERLSDNTRRALVEALKEGTFNHLSPNFIASFLPYLCRDAVVALPVDSSSVVSLDANRE